MRMLPVLAAGVVTDKGFEHASRADTPGDRCKLGDRNILEENGGVYIWSLGT
jgi:hypothetical protein